MPQLDEPNPDLHQAECHRHQTAHLQRHLFDEGSAIRATWHEHQVCPLHAACWTQLMATRYLLPNSVIQYIYDHRLYREPDAKAITN
jgi:nicotinic acid mononucleotide adenylyltransferase